MHVYTREGDEPKEATACKLHSVLSMVLWVEVELLQEAVLCRPPCSGCRAVDEDVRKHSVKGYEGV